MNSSFGNGYFDGKAKYCVPLQDNKGLDWRNSIPQEVFREIDPLKSIGQIRFASVTEQLWNMHNDDVSIGAVDCTHFCHFPQMWLPIWDQLDSLL